MGDIYVVIDLVRGSVCEYTKIGNEVEEEHNPAMQSIRCLCSKLGRHSRLVPCSNGKGGKLRSREQRNYVGKKRRGKAIAEEHDKKIL